MMVSQRFKIGIIIFVVILVFVLVNLTKFTKTIKNLFYFVSSPIQRTFWKTGDEISDFFVGLLYSQNLKKENDELKLKIQNLEAENSSLKLLKQENETLRAALQIGLEKEFKLSLAEVIGKDIGQDYLILNQGSKSGLKENQSVITQQKILCGALYEVYSSSSKVELITKKDFTFDVKIANPDDKEIYRAKGEGNGNLSLDFVPKEKEVHVGDVIVTSAMGGKFPSGLVVGEISDIQKTDIDPFQKAGIKPACNLSEIGDLFIIEI